MTRPSNHDDVMGVIMTAFGILILGLLLGLCAYNDSA